MEKNKYNIEKIISDFRLYGDFVSAETFGSGHINDTFRVCVNHGGTPVRYTLQRINHNIFKNPPALMENIVRVTTHIQSKLPTGDKTRSCLLVIPTTKGEPFHLDKDGNYWRAYVFVEGASTYNVIRNEKQAFEAAKAFGNFQKLLADMPAPRLHDTIPDFHNTPRRFEKLEAAIKKDAAGRVKDVGKEIDFCLKRKALTRSLVESGSPERITHNDTKINNVLLDDTTGEGICIIDLDTVMPGLVLYDFGDMCRTATITAAEDERDIDKVTMDIKMFEQLVKGYLASAGGFLTREEISVLALSAQVITFEIGIRFLTDHLDGDVYFKVHRDNHNLDRCRTQFKLVGCMENEFSSMEKLVKKWR